MTPTDRSAPDSRRSFLKHGVLATAIGVAASGTASAREETTEDEEHPGQRDTVSQPERNEQFTVIMFDDDFRRRARFVLTSTVVDWKPTIPVDLGDRLVEYDTYMGAYLNTGERFPIFVSEQASLDAEYNEEQGYFVSQDTSFEGGDFAHPKVYELTNEFDIYQQTDKVIRAAAQPLDDDAQEEVFDDERIDTREKFDEFLF